MGGLGDRKASVLMNEMLVLMDGHNPCLLFEQVFLEKMPDDIRLIFADGDFSDPRKLADRADELWRAKQQSEVVIDNVTAAARRTQRTTSALMDGGAVTPPVSAPNKEKWCYHHQKWGTEARRCCPPCPHPGNTIASRRQ